VLRICLSKTRLIGILLIFVTSLFPALGDPLYRMPKGNAVSVSQGLSQPSVSDITEDSRGFIWASTQGGVDRYNGSSFKNFTAKSDLTEGLPANVVQRLLYVHETNHLWIATLNGLTSVNLSKDTFQAYALSNSHIQNDRNVTALYFDSNDTFWVGTTEGVYRKTRQSESFVAVEYASRIGVRDITADPTGRIWLATSQGLFAVYAQTNTLKKVDSVSQKLNRVVVGSDNSIWIGSQNEGVFRYQLEPDSNMRLLAHITSKERLRNDSVNDLVLLSDGNIWAATTEGTSVISPQTNQVIATNVQSVASDTTQLADNVYAIHESADGHIFLGTRSNGIVVLDKGSVTFDRWRFGAANGSESITTDPNGMFWVSTQDGFYRFDKNKNIAGPWRFNEQDISKHGANSVKTIAYSSATDSLWIASSGGLAELKPSQEHAQFVDLLGTRIYTVRSGRNGNLWLGTNSEGLFYYDPLTKQTIKKWDMPLATDILDVSDSEIWVTTLAGLYRLNLLQDKVTLYEYAENNKTGLPFNVLSWISKKQDNQFYLGTLGQGVWIMSLKNNGFEVTFERLNDSPQLASSSVGGVLEDERGDVWISTTVGIVKHSADGSTTQYFNGEDGANSAGYYIGAALQANGQFFFAGLDGLTVFEPANLVINDYMPKLYIDKISVVKRAKSTQGRADMKRYGQLELPDTIVLSPDDLLLNIDFNALEYADVTSIRYAYRVVELDESWQYLEKGKQSATLMNLPPGTYRFEVKVSNRYQRWIDTPTTLLIKVQPGWYQTQLASLIFIFAGLLMLYAIYKWRTYNYMKRSLLLEDQVEEQTRELQSANEKFKKLSMQDALTGVFNRRGFFEFVDKEMAQYQRHHHAFSILLLDVDFFKQVNDTHGHDCGDKTLIHITKILKATIRQQDVLARWGGEEFIILLPDTDLDEATMVGHKIQTTIKVSPIMLNNTTVTCTITAGIACIDQFDSFDECVSYADTLLYKGKKSGRDKVVV